MPPVLLLTGKNGVCAAGGEKMQGDSRDTAKGRRDGRILFIDLMKTVAILLVLSFHAENYSFDFLREGAGPVLYLRYYCRALLSCCVPLFFFANGYLLLHRDMDLAKHIRKILRLILLTGLWAVIDTVLLLLAKGGVTSVAGLKAFLLEEEWREGWINHLWYIKALIVIYLLFPLIKTAYDRSRGSFLFFTAAAAVLTFGNKFINIAASLGGHVLLSGNRIYALNWFDGLNLFRGIYGYSFVYFCAGGLAEELLDRCRCLRSPRACVGILLVSMGGLFAAGVALSRMKNELWEIVWEGYDTVFTFVNVLCIYALCTGYRGRREGLRRAIAAVSANTLGIYFCHGFYNYLLIPRLEGTAWLSNIPGNLLITCLLLLLSLGTALLLRRIPVLRRLVT